MSRAVQPISQLARRVPEAGRIRIGEKTEKGAPKAIGEFRFTSHDRAAVDQIAAMYGGDVDSWDDPKAAAGQFEVVTQATEIRVVLPPDPLGGTPVYEMWGGGGCERRCDGVTCTITQTGPEGPEPVDVECLCAAQGALACNVTTHLSVILPEIRFAGVWRLTTKSWNAAQELPGMVDLIHQAQGLGLQYATLGLKHRRSTSGGQTRRFLVPTLGTDATVEQLAAGETRLAALPSTKATNQDRHAALAAGDPDEDVVDAEIVEPADPGVLEQIAEGIDRLDDAGKAELRAWWRESGFPPLTSGVLSDEQARGVLARLAELDPERPFDEVSS